ncbi:MAG TPA: bifunctional indole-3-glycerol-phosphate synthase TrpC/phosphoribosylanthranilate isomerase TrpF [Sphingomicrobium sp.]|nr:bifunctional indole-3-glycerol-phosphate synthase TrpC/phosphoribosylanthranilate isomerase TrpF [Sphingomicrobium sp.]
MPEPAGILAEIVAAKRVEIASRFDGVDLDSLRSGAEPTRKSLVEAIARPGARFIFEIKKASPSSGAIRADADVPAIARAYQGVADALSVLADGPFFGGSLADVTDARAEFDGPILAKDFFIDVRQVAEARLAGADAILVMLSVLDDRRAAEMVDEARRFGMDALVEVHDEAEMRRALVLGAPLIGINNRDLTDLSIDLATTQRLAPMASNRLLVAESGISGRADVERLVGAVDGFLVGSALMRADRRGEAARALAFGRVKLCGMRRGEDLAAGRPAAFAGFVFAAGSPRLITTDEAAPLADLARSRGQLTVGVFRGASVAEVAATASALNVHAVQIHGSIDAASLRRLIPADCELWSAVAVGRDDLAVSCGDRLLFDNGDGGTGRRFDWSLIRGHPDLARSLVAGGIGSANARSAQALGAYAIDVGSAVDDVPGAKSPAKITALFDALRPAGRNELRQCA